MFNTSIGKEQIKREGENFDWPVSDNIIIRIYQLIFFISFFSS